MNCKDIVLECIGLGHDFDGHPVLHDVNLKVERGSILSIVGPSGCGKSTLLRAMLGTHLPSRGQTVIRSKNGPKEGSVVKAPGRDRGIVYQRYSLFPFLTALENVAFGLDLEQAPLWYRLRHYLRCRQLRKQQRAQTAAFLSQLGLADALHLYPHQMSGGMCQRVALAQALILRPEVLLLDEPFGALDEVTRADLQRLLLRLYQNNLAARRRGSADLHTIVLVTHDLDEAIYVGDRVVGLSSHQNCGARELPFYPGSTIVYDSPARIFTPEQIVSPRDFEEQRAAIRSAVFVTRRGRQRSMQSAAVGLQPAQSSLREPVLTGRGQNGSGRAA